MCSLFTIQMNAERWKKAATKVNDDIRMLEMLNFQFLDSFLQ
jgi:hypothetical protein